jgi:YcxB-like protein
MAKNYAALKQAQMGYQQNPSNPGAVKTKKFALEKNKYTSISMKAFFKDQLKWVLVPLAIITINAVLNLTGTYKNIWIYLFAIIGSGLYILFWYIQYIGITQLEQYKQLFQKYRYEIDSRQILMKLNEKEGGVIKWDMIKSAYKDKTGYVLNISRGQFIYLPFDVFTSDNDRRMMDKILKDKSLVN